MTREEVNQVIGWHYDSQAYKQAYDSTASACEDLKQEKINYELVICQADSTIKAKDDHVAFETTKSEMLATDNKKLTKWNAIWRTGFGCTLFILLVEMIKNL